MPPKIEIVSDDRLILGEGPHWDSESQSLYLVDFMGKSILRYDSISGKVYKVKLDQKVTVILPIGGTKDQFLITLGKRLAIVTWDGLSSEVSKIEILLEVEKDKEGNTFNDGKVDSAGRVWIGSMGPFPGNTQFQGALYSLTSRYEIRKHVSNITGSNGITFSDNLKKLYHIDTPTRSVDSYDFDKENGEIGNKQTIFSFEDSGVPGLPDGMTIDSEDKLWVASVTGGRIIRIDPTNSKLLQTIEFPITFITSLTFGGPNLDTLYVTSGSFKLTDDDKPVDPLAGAIFKVTGLGVKGTPAYNAKL